jgi:hypothetical protein
MSAPVTHLYYAPMMESGTVTGWVIRWAMPCSGCYRDLEPGEPVWWRPHLQPGRVVPSRLTQSGLAITSGNGPVCRSCAGNPADESSYRGGVPCVGCARPVYWSPRINGGARRRRSLAYCHEYCLWDHYNRRRSEAAAELRLKDCATCGERFEATRRDAVTCSPACRQKAYRRRAAEGRAA